MRHGGGRAQPDLKFAAIQGKVLVHVGTNARGAQLLRHADGAVLHGRPGLKAASELSGDNLVAVDPEHYTDDRTRKPQQQLPLEQPQEHVLAQTRARASLLLAPSNFPVDRSEKSIHKQLEAGEAFIEAAHKSHPQLPVVVPVVIRSDELRDGRWIEPIESSDLPIATVFAGYTNPLAKPDHVEGAIRVIQAAHFACVLRCDMSAVGLMAKGAATAALGSSSGVRQLWLRSGRRGRQAASSDSIFVPKAAGWMPSAFLQEARLHDELKGVFHCSCAVCGEDGDVRVLVSPGAERHLREEHSIASAVDLAHTVLGASDPVSAWTDACDRAVATYDHLRDFGIADVSRPEVLDSWLTVLRREPAVTTSQTLLRR